MTLVFTKAARSDLQSIYSYTAYRWGEEQAERYVAELWEKCEEILSDPKRWRYRRDLFPECQIASQGKHVILFRQDRTTLEIARILHGAMDFPKHLGDYRKTK